jgi:adenylate cyclase
MTLRILSMALIGLVIGLVAGLCSLTAPGERLENRYALGILYALRQPLQPPPGAVIIAIDKQTLAWLRDKSANDEKTNLLACMPGSAQSELDKIRGPGSLPRSVHACLLQELRRLGVSIAAFDILFSVPGNSEDDEKLAAALRGHGSAVILVGYERSVMRDGASELLVEREIRPLALFQQNAAAAGAFIVTRSGGPVYGYWRRVAGFEDTPSLPEEVLRLRVSQSEGKKINSLPDGSFRYLWLYGPPGSIETISARDILRGLASDRVLGTSTTSAAFIGASDPDTTNFPDAFPSFFQGPSDADMSGVELLATAYLNLLHGEHLQHLSTASSFGLIVLFALGLALVAQIRGRFAMFGVACAALLYLFIAAFLFARLRILLPLGTPLFIIAPLMWLLALAMRYRFARALIMHLMPAPVARRLLTSSVDEHGPMVAEDATVVFFDVIGSTTIAEKIPALEFSNLMNAYHETVTHNVGKHRGYVSAFAGDGVVVVFSKTDAGPDHAIFACRSILAVIKELGRMNNNNKNTGIPPLGIRVGVNSGMIAAGELGSRDRFNFSVVGDVVNLAARLEQLGKSLCSGEKDVILVGISAWRLASQDEFRFVDYGVCSIPGRESPEHVYRLAI